MEKGYAHQDRDVRELQERLKKVRNEIHIQGKIIKFHRTPLTADLPKPAKRGQIKGYSPGSRRRLLDCIARLDWQRLNDGMFVTLTYPDEVAAVDMATATMQRTHFIRYVEKHLSEKTLMLWRKEHQRRKSGENKGISVQHFHLCIFTAKRIECWRINDWWKRSIQWPWNVQTHRKVLTSGIHAAFYFAKYLTVEKPQGILEYVSYLTKPGRAWGWHRKELRPFLPHHSFVGITDEQWDSIMEQVLVYKPKAVTFGMESFTILGKDADDAAKVIYEVLY